MPPLLNNTVFSAMLMASAWSCVAYTMVSAQVLLQFTQLVTHFLAQLGVQSRQRLVHQAQPGLPHQRPAKRHALLLPA